MPPLSQPFQKEDGTPTQALTHGTGEEAEILFLAAPPMASSRAFPWLVHC